MNIKPGILNQGGSTQVVKNPSDPAIASPKETFRSPNPGGKKTPS